MQAGDAIGNVVSNIDLSGIGDVAGDVIEGTVDVVGGVFEAVGDLF